MERDGESNQRNDTLPGTKTRNKKPIGTKKKTKRKNEKKKPGTYSSIEFSVSSSKD